jgi:uncharacterized protein YjiS (DUF1127 family)
LYQHKSKKAAMPYSASAPLSVQARFGLPTRILRALRLALVRRQSRRCLSRLDPRLLRDIGLSPYEAQTECAKPFWRD